MLISVLFTKIGLMGSAFCSSNKTMFLFCEVDSILSVVIRMNNAEKNQNDCIKDGIVIAAGVQGVRTVSSDLSVGAARLTSDVGLTRI